MRLLRASLAGLLALSLASLAALALDFPALTGRVVDQADILSPAVRTDVAAQSKELEEKSGIQLVVATVPSLQGSDIETFANQLFRAWELGQAQKNNGVLLLVAPNERKVRIEVGYGLEGTLTDALASTIISGAIVPHFKRGDFSGGVEGGVHGIVAVLRTDPSQWQAQALVAAPQAALVRRICDHVRRVFRLPRRVRSLHQRLDRKVPASGASRPLRQTRRALDLYLPAPCVRWLVELGRQQFS